MKNYLLRRFGLLTHFFLSGSKFTIHSPFVFQIYSEILKDKTNYAAYSSPIIGTGNRTIPLSNRDYRLLFRLSRYFKPKTILILGTTDGSCVSYIESGCPGSHLSSFHDILDLTADSGVFDMAFVLGDLTGNVIPDYFSRISQHIHNDSVLIFGNIHGSKEMHEVWNEIKNHSSVTLTIDLFNLGLVFCKEELTKQDFILRY